MLLTLLMPAFEALGAATVPRPLASWSWPRVLFLALYAGLFGMTVTVAWVRGRQIQKGSGAASGAVAAAEALPFLYVSVNIAELFNVCYFGTPLAFHPGPVC